MHLSPPIAAARPGMSAAGRVLPQRPCACAAAGASCARCSGSLPTLQRKASGALPSGTDLPAGVRNVLAAPGMALDASRRAPMERSFGIDFSHVRIHSDAAATASARTVNAHAYTVGNHIVLGAGGHDRQLLAHELAHVVQQSGPGSGASAAALEHEADRAASAVEHGAPFEVRGARMPALQRKPDGGAGAYARQKAIDGALAALGLDSNGTRLVTAGITGAVDGFSKQWNEGGTAGRLKQHGSEFSIGDMPALLSGFVQGAIQGVVSPITDLFSLFVMLEAGRDLVARLALSVLSGKTDLAGEFDALLGSLNQMADPIQKTLRGMKAKPLATLKMLLDFASSQGPMMGKLEAMAASAGQSGGKAIAASLEEPWQKQEHKESPSFSVWKSPLQWANQKMDQAGEALLSGVWGKVGNKVGYALGFAVVQVVLLVFSEGIGTLITSIGRGMGSIAKAGTLLGNTLEGIGKFVRAAGTGIRLVEEGVAAAMAFLAKPFLPVLEPLLKPFGNALDRLGKFLRKLFGVAEKDAAHLATTAAARAEGALVPHAPGPPPAPHAPGPHAPVPHPEPAPHPASAHADAPATKPAQAPHVEADAPARPRPGPADGRGKIMAEEPTPDGHAVRIREGGGIELCSPEPCPLLEHMYADIIGGSVPMKAEMDAIKALRKTNPKLAARRSARFKKELDALAERNQQFRAAAEREAESFKDWVRSEGGDPDAMIRRQPGKTGSSTAPGHDPLKQDISLNIDEIDPVGARFDPNGVPLTAQERLRRATSLGNREFKDALTNQRTKHVGVDARDAARRNAPRKSVSLKTGSGGKAARGREHMAIFDRPLGELKEFQAVHAQVLEKLEQGGALGPGEMKARLNAGIWDEIRHPTTRDGVVIANALERAGFGVVVAPDGKMVLRALTGDEMMRRGFTYTEGGWIKGGR